MKVESMTFTELRERNVILRRQFEELSASVLARQDEELQETRTNDNDEISRSLHGLVGRNSHMPIASG